MLNPNYRKKKRGEMGLTEEEFYAKQFEINNDIPEPLMKPQPSSSPVSLSVQRIRNMNFWKLYIASFMSILKLLLITALGAFLAHDRFNILRENARKHLNAMVYFVFTPALIYSSMSNTLTFRSMVML
ncbi:hypothetical protein JHK87_018110 [Glycine soja]|nr:hypothetical protein JHK87_018110 [Glycine soja]